MLAKKVKIGFIPANRGFFSDVLAARMRGETDQVQAQVRHGRGG